MIDILDIAYWFLNKEPMSLKKLHKLCYYAQAWHCAFYIEPLFNSEIQAWVHGPTIPELKSLFSEYNLYDTISCETFDESILDDTVIYVLESVYYTYSKLTEEQLESLTRNEEPWKLARGNLKPWETCTNIISCDTLSEYYSEMYRNNKG